MAFVTEGKRVRNDPKGSGISAPNLKQTRVHEDEGRAVTKALASANKEEETLSDGKDGWLHVNSNDTL